MRSRFIPPGPAARRPARAGAAVSAVLLCAGACQQPATQTGSRHAPPAAATPVAPGSARSSAGRAPAASGPGSCRARGSGAYVLPDPSCTPGALNPAVTQADIDRTICSAGWTATVRPPESYTEPLKLQQKAAYGEAGPVSSYEEDHLVPLELGGSPTSPRNLWPEPGASPNPKDRVEDAANHAVCQGTMSLAAARQAIATDWIALGQRLGAVPAQVPANPAATGPATTTGPASPVASAAGPAATGPAVTAACSVTASYDARYGDWDVYVRSNQPDQGVTVTVAGGATASWRTDGSGGADVYLHTGENQAGQALAVTAGAAACSGKL